MWHVLLVYSRNCLGVRGERRQSWVERGWNVGGTWVERGRNMAGTCWQTVADCGKIPGRVGRRSGGEYLWSSLQHGNANAQIHCFPWFVERAVAAHTSGRATDLG